MRHYYSTYYSLATSGSNPKLSASNPTCSLERQNLCSISAHWRMDKSMVQVHMLMKAISKTYNFQVMSAHQIEGAVNTAQSTSDSSNNKFWYTMKLFVEEPKQRKHFFRYYKWINNPWAAKLSRRGIQFRACHLPNMKELAWERNYIEGQTHFGMRTGAKWVWPSMNQTRLLFI